MFSFDKKIYKNIIVSLEATYMKVHYKLNVVRCKCNTEDYRNPGQTKF